MRRSSWWLPVALPVVCTIGLLAGLERALALVSDTHQDWRMASYSQDGLEDTERAITRLQQAIQAAKTDTLAARVVPTLSQVEESAWQFGLATRRAERAITTSKERRSIAQYTIALGGPATDLVAFLHSLETNYLCRLSQTTLQKADETGRAVLIVSLEVAE